jgi:hypothetical protein
MARVTGICIATLGLLCACAVGEGRSGPEVRARSGASVGVAAGASQGPVRQVETRELQRSRDVDAAPMKSGRAPAPGVYRYESSEGDERSSTVLRIRSVADGPEGHEFSESLQEFGDTTNTRVIWEPNGKWTKSTESVTARGEQHCDWSPEVATYRFPLKRGSHWTFRGNCPLMIGTGRAFLFAIAGEAKVVGAVEARFGSKAFPAWVIESRSKVTLDTPDGRMETRIDAVDRFVPSLGLSVASAQKRSQSYRGRTSDVRRTARTLLDPAPR